MLMRKMDELAKKTFLAFYNPYQSVEKVFPNVIDQVGEGEGTYLGVKDSGEIPQWFVEFLKGGGYFQHTVDRASIGGRDIDVFLKNPFTGRPMTGSSSGTALNVLLGINDIGLGTDGGGSVLAPAMSLNLFGFVSPLLGAEYFQSRTVKMSADGLLYSASLGFITKDFEEMEKATFYGLNLPTKVRKKKLNVDVVEGSAKFTKPRLELMEDLKDRLDRYDLIISKEGPVDAHGLGDTLFDQFDPEATGFQIMGARGYLRVVNMLGYTGLCVPTDDFASSLLFICKSDLVDIARMFAFARLSPMPTDEIAQRYFANANAYFEAGINVSKK